MELAMEHQVNIHVAKTEMLKFIELAQSGQEFIRAKAGKLWGGANCSAGKGWAR